MHNLEKKTWALRQTLKETNKAANVSTALINRDTGIRLCGFPNYLLTNTGKGRVQKKSKNQSSNGQRQKPVGRQVSSKTLWEGHCHCEGV